MDKQNLSVLINLTSFDFGLAGVPDRQMYIKALYGEIASVADYADSYIVNTLYLTGANPLQYNGSIIGEIIKTLGGVLPFSKDIEITVNAVPGSVTYFDLVSLKKAGVKRISFDMGSFSQSELDGMERTYSPRAMEVFMRMVQRKMTFFNYDVSLFYGLPHQTAESIRTSVENAIQSMAVHITLLPYQGADKTQLFTLYETAVNVIGVTNYEQYTPHHFARPGYASLWNKLTSGNQPSLGFGAGSSWQIEGLFCENTSDASVYMASEGIPSDEVTRVKEISPSGIESNDVKNKLYNLKACDLSSLSNGLRVKIEQLFQQGFLEKNENTILLTPSGKADWQTVSEGL